MGSDYLFVIGVILLFHIKTIWLGILCIIGASIYKKRKTKKVRNKLILEDM